MRIFANVCVLETWLLVRMFTSLDNVCGFWWPIQCISGYHEPVLEQLVVIGTVFPASSTCYWLLFQGAIFQISADVSTKLSHQGWNTDYTTDRRLGLCCVYIEVGHLAGSCGIHIPIVTSGNSSYVHSLLWCMANTKRYLISPDWPVMPWK